MRTELEIRERLENAKAWAAQNWRPTSADAIGDVVEAMVRKRVALAEVETLDWVLE